MLEMLIHTGEFLLQAIILVVAILILVAGIMAIASKGKDKSQNKIKVTMLNKKYEEARDEIESYVYPKEKYKLLQKDRQKALKKAEKQHDIKKRIFVLNFIGDIKASAVNNLRHEITAILSVATPQDEVVVCLESAGGMVHSYGLAASQLQRIRARDIPLTIAIDKVAASGGYMMACVANRIIAAPFAIVGSIGVLAQLPNFHRLLKKNAIEFEQITAGEYKRTLTLFGENTETGRKKLQEEVNDMHELFKTYIKTHRPQIEIEKVATGEHWFATRAMDLKLVDELSTSDDYLTQASQQHEILTISYGKTRKRLLEKLLGNAQGFLQHTNLFK